MSKERKKMMKDKREKKDTSIEKNRPQPVATLVNIKGYNNYVDRLWKVSESDAKKSLNEAREKYLMNMKKDLPTPVADPQPRRRLTFLPQPVATLLGIKGPLKSLDQLWKVS
ncbi:OLC1v1001631C1 [Oldenlandia corymbosa var. corymbosa]|uniref:OLC1v1001631C1 n=1 Tax=Oldenlandia corymbosa var. corymbosa TaxID=529605 RepID=A0AAV1D807_OLDCO|nr:OLC1v1001631C1 [Oldenlandia corymbosa var. corymbosa]